ncbi:hypothetical protein MMC25_003954 [Agyrium rufum]|nr:hypothetical protein [Agyrium rufum]
MSFDRLPITESQPTTMRRNEDPEYQDDPQFNRFSEQLGADLFSLTSDIGNLSRQVSLLGTKRDTERVRERIHNLLDDLREGFKNAGDGVKRLTSWEDLNASQKYTQQKLAREFQASGSEFQSIQRLALEKQRATASANRQALDSGDTSSFAPYSDSQGGGQQQQQQQQEQPHLASQDEVDFQESLIIERESEIRNIEQSVGELNELFRDVAHIVHEQGAQLDTIDVNVSNTVTDTRQADVELRAANRYQKNARGKAFCLLIILAVVLLIIILAAVLG